MKATFESDFSDFRDEVARSITSMRTFEGQADSFARTLDAADVPAVDRLHQSLLRFDGAMSAVGININSEVRALTELAGAAGHTVGELGALSTAGLAVSTAIAAWQFGRAIAEALELDDAIANTTAKLFGFGDVAAESAAAGADTLAAASRVAGREITDLGEAIGITTERMRELRQAGAPAEGEDQIKKWAGELALLNEAGVLNRLKDDIESHNFSLQQLSTWYDTSAQAIQYFTRVLNEQHAEEEAGRRRDEQNRTAFERDSKQREEAQRRVADANKRGMEDFERDLRREFELGTKVWTEGTRLLEKQNEAMEKRLKLQTDFVSQLILERSKAVDANTERNLGPATVNPADIAANRRDAALARIDAQRERAPDFDFGPMIQKIWQDFDEQILKRGAAAAEPPVQVNVSGLLDPRTIRELTDAISEEQQRRSGRLWPGR